MKQMNDRTQLGLPTAGQPAPRNRFRIQKLEERIAPMVRHCGHLNPKGKWVGGGICG